MENPKLYTGGMAVDERGIVTFNNGLDLSDVKRFYTIENHTDGFIRAWHGHRKEGKFFMVLSGIAIIVALKLHFDNDQDAVGWISPYTEEERFKQTLIKDTANVFYIPPGYANGFKLLTRDTRIIVFSTSTLEESTNDDYRYEFDKQHHSKFFGVVER
jgi:dTDP-4-dehydrorhamnose 3,5-epimerase